MNVFYKIMWLVDRHSAFLQSIGFSKWFVRNYSPVHILLSKLAFYVLRHYERKGEQK